MSDSVGNGSRSGATPAPADDWMVAPGVLTTIIRAAPLAAGMVVRRELREVNSRMCELLGYRRDELIGQSSRMLYPSEQEFEAVGRDKYAQMREGGVGSVETRWRGKDGSVIDVLLSSAAVDPTDLTEGVAFTAVDISDRKRVERALQESERILREVIDLVPLILFAKDANGRFLLANRTLADAYGVAAEELLGRTDRDFLPSPEQARRFQEDDLDVIAAGKQRRCPEETIVDAAGRARVLQTTKVPFRFGPAAVPAVLGVAVEVTEQRRVLEQLQRTIDGTIAAMAAMVETRDPYTSGHQRRVAELATAIATEVGLPADRVEAVRVAGTIHDLGKVGVPAEILSKPGPISEIEMELIRTHARVGYEILRTIDFPWPIAEIVLEHHERPDGAGYPRGLEGDAILLEARILSVADAVESIASHRPYRPARGVNAAMAELERCSGSQFDPTVVEVCLRLLKEGRFTLD